MKQKIIKLSLLVAVLGLLAFLIINGKPKHIDLDKTLASVAPPAPIAQVSTAPVTPPVDPEKEKLLAEKAKQAKYKAGKTPAIAWKTLVNTWKDKEKSPNLGIYTDSAKLIYQGVQNLPDSYYENKVSTYADQKYKVLTKGGYAVIYFVDSTGKPSPSLSPFLFCRTKDGWKYDLIHQRKLVRTGENSDWGIGKYISPYQAILRMFPSYSEIDIPWQEKDIYKISNDTQIAEKIKGYEELVTNKKITYEQVFDLGRLYAITAQGLKAIPLLTKYEEKMPDIPDVHKYLAIAYVDSSYNYESAQKEMEKYVELLPKDEFGHSFLGYLLVQAKTSEKAIPELEKAIKINPQSCYATEKLSKIYGEKIDDKKSLQNSDKLLKIASKICRGDNYERFISLMQAKIQRDYGKKEEPPQEELH